jgi:hypothetical protein
VVAVAAGLPVTVRPVQLPHAGVGIKVYWVMVSPLPTAAVHERLTVPSGFGVAVNPVGASGGPSSMTGLDAADDAPEPIMLVAVTVKEYEVPTVSPVSVVEADVGVSPVQPPHAGDGVTVYPVMVAPLLAGAVQLTVMFSLISGVALTAVGAPGTATSVIGAEAGDAGPVPIALVAVTVKV